MIKYFPSQQEDEEVILLMRRHWFVLLRPVVIAGFIYLLSLFGVFILPWIFPVILKPFYYNFYLIFLSLLFLFNTLFLFLSWLIYYLNVGIITTEHIVDIDQVSIFNRKISTLSLDKIQDVSASQKGVLQTMLKYGDIIVQTAGELPNFEFFDMPNPYENSQKIMEIQEEFLKRTGITKDQI